jgi:hypothetical protein
LASDLVLVRGGELALAGVDLRLVAGRMCLEILEFFHTRIPAKTFEIMDLGVKFLNHREKI